MEEKNNVTLYTRRWFILIIYFLNAQNTSLILMTFASIQEITAEHFQIRDQDIWMVNLASFVYFVKKNFLNIGFKSTSFISFLHHFIKIWSISHNHNW